MTPSRSAGKYVDAKGTTRVSRIEDLPDESVRSYAFGHQWQDELPRDAVGWGKGVDAQEFRFTCSCGRWKREVLDANDGDKLVQDYGGGTMLFPGSDFPKHLAKIEWLRRVRAKAKQAPGARPGKRATVVPLIRNGTDGG
jgi:hypothetical protein